MRLKDKVSLITGGAQGIGKEISRLFLEQGCRVCIFDVNQETLDSTEKEFKDKGYEILSVKVDITKTDEVSRGIKFCLDRFKRIDILVNNAGITRDKIFIRMSDDDWDKVLDVNLKGTFIVSRETAKVMLKQKEGKIINISSIIGLIGNPGQANYSASKGGLISLTKTLAKELSSRNITVNAVCPGYIRTAMTDALSEEVKQKMLERIYLGRLGEPLDVASVCLFLASREADYITGQALVVDGGLTL